MRASRTWIRRIGAIAATLAIAGCAPVVSEPLSLDSTNQRATSVLDPSKQIKDLSPAEAEAWCTGYVNLMFSRLPGQLENHGPQACLDSSPVPDENGYVAANDLCPMANCDNGEIGATNWYCLNVQPVDVCVKNLTLHACEGTLSELDACVDSASNWSDDTTPCGHHCIAFQAHPGCGETIATARPLGPTWDVAACNLAVE